MSDELRGSTPIMSTKDILLEVYNDMKFVRPAIEGLLAAQVIRRIEVLEKDMIVREASEMERHRVVEVSGKLIMSIVVISNLFVVVAIRFMHL
jgi:hypothetical protein